LEQRLMVVGRWRLLVMGGASMLVLILLLLLLLLVMVLLVVLLMLVVETALGMRWRRRLIGVWACRL
jgi:hypothetical protein